MTKSLFLSLVPLGIVSFLCILIETALNVTFPYIIRFYGVDISTASLLTSMFLLAITLLMPLSSYIVQRFNTKHIFIFTSALFTIGLLMCVFFELFYVLILARFLQGIAAGLALPLMYNIVIIKAPKHLFGFLMGFCVFLIATAPGFGPIYGGYMMQYAKFSDIFIYLVPLTLIAFFIGVFNIENLQSDIKPKLDFKEYFSIIFMILCLVACIKNQIFLIPLAFIFFILYKIKSPIMKEALNVSFLSATFVVFFFQFQALSYSLLLPNYLIHILDFKDFDAGKSMLAGCIVAALLAPFSGYLSDRFKAFKLVMSGISFMVIAAFMFLKLEKGLFNFTISYLVFSLGQGLSISVIIAHAIKVSVHKTNANAFLNTIQQYFGVLGVMVVSMIFNDNYLIGFDNAIKLLLTLTLISLVLVFVSFRHSKYTN